MAKVHFSSPPAQDNNANQDKATAPTAPSSETSLWTPAALEAALDSDEVVVGTVVRIYERGWTPRVQEQLVSLREERERQLLAACRTNFGPLSQGVAHLGALRGQAAATRSHVIATNADVQRVGSVVVSTRRKLEGLQESKANLIAASERTAVCMQVVRQLDRAREQVRSRAFVPALRSAQMLRRLNAQLRAGGGHKAGSKSGALMDVVDVVLPRIENGVRQQVRADVVAWLSRARGRAKVVGRLALDRAHVRMLVQRELLSAGTDNIEQGGEVAVKTVGKRRAVPVAAQSSRGGIVNGPYKNKDVRRGGGSTTKDDASAASSTNTSANDHPAISEVVSAFDLSPVVKFVHVSEFLNERSSAAQFYRKKRLQQGSLEHLSPDGVPVAGNNNSISVDVNARQNFAESFTNLLCHAVGFFLLEDEISQTHQLISRSELQVVWSDVCVQLRPVLFDHLTPASLTQWCIGRPDQLLSVTNHLLWATDLFAQEKFAADRAHEEDQTGADVKNKEKNKKKQDETLLPQSLNRGPMVNLCEEVFENLQQGFSIVVTHAAKSMVNEHGFEIWDSSAVAASVAAADITISTNKSLSLGKSSRKAARANTETAAATKQTPDLKSTLASLLIDMRELDQQRNQPDTQSIKADAKGHVSISRVVPFVMELALQVASVWAGLATATGKIVRFESTKGSTNSRQRNGSFGVYGGGGGGGNAAAVSAVNGAAFVFEQVYISVSRFVSDDNADDLPIERACRVADMAHVLGMACHVIASRIDVAFGLESASETNVGNNKDRSGGIKVTDKLQEVVRKFEGTVSAAHNMVMEQVRSNLEELLSSSAFVDWTPESASAVRQKPHDFVADTLTYLRDKLSPTGPIMLNLPPPIQEAILFLSCRLLATELSDVLTSQDGLNSPMSHGDGRGGGGNGVKAVNWFALEILHNDVRALERFAEWCVAMPGLEEAFSRVRQLVGLLVDGRLDLFLRSDDGANGDQSRANRKHFASLSDEDVITALIKYERGGADCLAMAADRGRSASGRLSLQATKEAIRVLKHRQERG